MPVTAKLVVGLSLVATAATVANALYIHKQFFPSMLYITKSSASMTVIYFQAVIMVFMIFQVMKRLFFGELRAAETEHLSERAWHAILETCLAFTVFRDDFSPYFVMQFVMLLFIKCFHWLADDRVDVMERSPLITLKFHIRMLSVIGTMAAIDSYLVSHAYFSIILKGASSQLVFGFEYAILITMVIHVAIKYILHMHDLRTAQTWESKAVYLLYAELVMNCARCGLYFVFAMLMMRLHTFPLFSIRPFYLSVRALHKAFNDVILSRRAITAMNTMFPVVTDEELANMDATCIICREEMTGDSQPKRLPCSHVFHAHCLRSWFQRQQTCPTCRTDILGLYLISNKNCSLANRNQANQEPAPQPQAQPGPIPFMPFAHQFAFHPPPPQMNANNEAGENGGQQQENHAPDPNQPTPVPPFPAFPMPPLAFGPPIPPPFGLIQLPSPPVLNILTDDQLRSLEGQTRDAVIKRIELLRDITTLLDAADLMTQQYLRVANMSGIPVNPGATAASTSATPTQPQADESSTEPSTSETAVEQESEEEQPGTSGSLFGPPSESTNATEAATENTSELVEPAESAEEIRQRRLRHFDADA